MCSAVSSTDGGGVLIFFLLLLKTKMLGKSWGKSYMVDLTTLYLCSDVNIMKLSLVMLAKPRVSLLQTLQRII